MKVFVTFVLMLATLQASSAAEADLQRVRPLIDEGHWQQAGREIQLGLAQPDLDFGARESWLFENDRMARIRADFNKSREQVFKEARAIIPGLSEETFARWEKEGAAEFMEIDGKRWFYDRAAGNIFRIHPEARTLKAKAGMAVTKPYRLEDIKRIISA